MTQEIETIRRPRGPVGTNRWTMNADDMLPGQGRRSFLIPNYIRDVSMKVTRRSSTIEENEMVFLYLWDSFLRATIAGREIEGKRLPTESKFNGDVNIARSKFAEFYFGIEIANREETLHCRYLLETRIINRYTEDKDGRYIFVSLCHSSSNNLMLIEIHANISMIFRNVVVRRFYSILTS